MTDEAGMSGAESAPMAHMTAHSCQRARPLARAPPEPAESGSSASSAAVPPSPTPSRRFAPTPFTTIPLGSIATQ